MKAIVQRKCKACKNPIEIHRSNIRGVVYFKNFYYHSECFCDLAQQKIQSKRGNPQEWKEALENLSDLEKRTKELLTVRLPRQDATDALNVYLLSQYNVTTMPKRFWQTVSDLNNGIYKQKRCKKISTETLLGAWQWGQRNLNDIDKRNKANHKGPADDNQRISYDLAILIKKIPDYLAAKAKREAAQEVAKETVRIDYSTMIRTDRKIEEGLDDISDLLDDDDD